jgi:hypothetical protein
VRAEVARVELHVPLQDDMEEHLGLSSPAGGGGCGGGGERASTFAESRTG